MITLFCKKIVNRYRLGNTESNVNDNTDFCEVSHFLNNRHATYLSRAMGFLLNLTLTQRYACSSCTHHSCITFKIVVCLHICCSWLCMIWIITLERLLRAKERDSMLQSVEVKWDNLIELHCCWQVLKSFDMLIKLFQNLWYCCIVTKVGNGKSNFFFL